MSAKRVSAKRHSVKSHDLRALGHAAARDHEDIATMKTIRGRKGRDAKTKAKKGRSS